MMCAIVHPQFSRKLAIKKQLCQGRAAKFAIWVKSALRELRCTTGSLQTVLLTFLHTRIAGQEAFLLQSSTVLLVLLQQSAAQAVEMCIRDRHIMGPKPGDLPMVRLKWK